MTTYNDTVLSDANLSHKKPWTIQKARAMRDNPIAITEGAPGAPRIVDAALDATATITGAGWVAARMALVGTGGIGTPAYLGIEAGAAVIVAPGATVTGWQYAGESDQTLSGVTAPGTWRSMGYLRALSGSTVIRGVFLRIL